MIACDIVTGILPTDTLEQCCRIVIRKIIIEYIAAKQHKIWMLIFDRSDE